MQSPVTPRYTYTATPLVSNRAYATHRQDGEVNFATAYHTRQSGDNFINRMAGSELGAGDTILGNLSN
jgi:hypothetical protein